ncbi:hypothetical protein D3C86_2055630 [compost metagenome]
MMRQVFAAQHIERFLRLRLAERDEIADQIRIAAGIGLVDQFVIARQTVNAHLMHGGGHAKGDAGGWILQRLHWFRFPERRRKSLDGHRNP